MPAPPLRHAAGVVTGGMTSPNLPRAALPLVVLLTLPGCASTPAIETRVSGTLPGERAYTVVDAAKHYGAGEALPLAAAEACLARAGFHRAEGAPGEALLQLARTVRPGRTRVLVGEESAGKVRGGAHAREELVLALSDPASGGLLVRASAARQLKPGQRPGADDVGLVAGLCGALTAPRAGAGAG